MSAANYERQCLAIHAAGFISAAGTSIVTFGCQMTRTAAGVYGMRLDPSNGLVDDESFTVLQRKEVISAGANVVQDTDNFFKTFRTFDSAGAALDVALEIALWKSVTH